MDKDKDVLTVISPGFYAGFNVPGIVPGYKVSCTKDSVIACTGGSVPGVWR